MLHTKKLAFISFALAGAIILASVLVIQLGDLLTEALPEILVETTPKDKPIVLQIENYSFELELNDPDLETLFASAMPLELEMARWGGQFYAPNPLPLNAQDHLHLTQQMRVGDLAVWPPANTLCIFFGSTPPSPGPAPRLGAAGLVLGKLKGNLTELKNLKNSTRVTLSTAD